MYKFQQQNINFCMFCLDAYHLTIFKKNVILFSMT